MSSVDDRPRDPSAASGGDENADKRRADSAEARVRALAVQLEQARTALIRAEEKAEAWKHKAELRQSQAMAVQGAASRDEAIERLYEEHSAALERAITANAIKMQEVRSAAEIEAERLRSELSAERQALQSARARIEALAESVQELQHALSDAASERDKLRGELEYMRAQAQQDRESRRPPPMNSQTPAASTSVAPRAADPRPDGTYIITDKVISDEVGDHPRRRRRS